MMIDPECEDFIPDHESMTDEQIQAADDLMAALESIFGAFPELAHITAVMGWGFDPGDYKTTRLIKGENVEPTNYELDRAAADCATVAGDVSRDRATNFRNCVHRLETQELSELHRLLGVGKDPEDAV